MSHELSKPQTVTADSKGYESTPQECAGNTSTVKCEDALARLCEYLDSECSELDFDELRRHFDDCSPCLTEYTVTASLKTKLKAACDCEAAPAELRESLRLKITTWCATVEQ